MRIMFFANSAAFFYSHRIELARSCLRKGYQVHLVAPLDIPLDTLKKEGLCYHKFSLSKYGMNWILELFALIKLMYLCKRLSPSLVHAVTVKPVIYAGMVARLLRIPCVVLALPGLGQSLVHKLTASDLNSVLIRALLGMALNHKNCRVILQNKDDLRDIVDAGFDIRKKVRLIRGSGVSLKSYSYNNEPEKGELIVVMACRLLRQKGIPEYVEAAKILSKLGRGISMELYGSIEEGNPDSLDRLELAELRASTAVRFRGYSAHMEQVYRACHIVCLPSYYGEGLPKSLIEAAACGRPIVTTNHRGCRDAVVDGSTGILVPVKDPKALADAITMLSSDNVLRKEMGVRARRFAEQHFDINGVTQKHLKIYKDLSDSCD